MTSHSKKIRIWFKEQSSNSLFFAVFVIVAIIYVGFGFGYDKDYHKNVIAELRLAQKICENSLNWVQADPKRLKMGQSDLKNIKVKGKKIELKHVKYPSVVFLDSGIRKINDRRATATDLYCVLKDPRSGGAEYYFNYDQRRWVDRVRFHR